ncbi:BapA/Bap/LapF family prefix-like domain-containing protein, partial [Acinetobacter pittii]|uniref:BapA/Bap/LapF family prefix-like domain-containing protein n=1 Tax=Acinetobacter pittii TaxID=48296 RepID=UPI0034CF1095
MVDIKVVSKETHEVLENVISNEVTLKEVCVVVVKVAQENVVEIRQDGKNAIIFLKNGEQIVIINFFSSSNYSTNNSLVFEEDNHKLLWVQFTDNNGALLEHITYNYIDSIEPLLYHDGAASPWAWLSVPLTAAGILWWAHDSGDKTDDAKQKDTT